MRNLIRSLAFVAALTPAVAVAQSQVPLPANTVWGRMGIGTGPGQAIPFATLFAQFQAISGAVSGPGTTVAGDFALWGNNIGTGLTDGGAPGTGVLAALLNTLNATGGLVGFSGALGTPTSVVLTHGTGLPISTGLTGAGSGVLAAMANSVNTSGGLLTFNGAFGTPTSLTLTNATGLPLNSGVIGQLPIANNCPGSSGASSSTFLRGDCSWATPSGAGNVSGPGSSTVGDIATYSNTSGTGIQDSGVAASKLPVLLNTVTASNSATVSDTTSMTGSYSFYEIVFENIIPATAANTLNLQVHVSGGSFATSGYVTEGFVPSGTAIVSISPTTAIPLNNTSGQTNASPGISGHLRTHAPSASAIHSFIGITTYNGSGTTAPWTVSGYLNSVGIIDGFQISFPSGNIASGVVKVYGYP